MAKGEVVKTPHLLIFWTDMETRSIHFKSDFLVRLVNEVDWSTPFSIRFFTTRAVSAKVVAFDGENYVGCTLDDSTGALLVPFERFTELYRQGLGTLRMELTYRLSNALYPDQYQDVVLPAQPVVCTNDDNEQFYLSLALTGDDDVEVSASVVAPFMVGPQGAAGTGISTMTQTSASVASAGANVWKMTLTDGREFSFTVLNGEKGDTGAQGPQGPQGAKGAKGDKGDKGDTGARGPQGEQGPRGIPGPRGEKGAKGDTGARGLKGETGPAGNTPRIGQNGNWWIGGTDTGVKADYSGTEAQRQSTFEANEAERDETFEAKEATRDAANEAALNCADELAALGPKIGDVNVRTKSVVYADITMTKGAVVGSTGANASSDNFYRTPYIDIDGYEKVKFLGNTAIISNFTFGYAFYSSDSASDYLSGSRFDVNTSLSDYEQKEYNINIPTGAKYFRCCIYKTGRSNFYLLATVGKSLNEKVNELESSLESATEDINESLENLEDSVEEISGQLNTTENLTFTFKIGDTNVNTGAPNTSSQSGCIRTGLLSIKSGTSISVDSGYQFKVSVYSSSSASSSTWDSEASRAFSSDAFTAEGDIYAIIVLRKYPIVTPPSLDWSSHIHVVYSEPIKDSLTKIGDRVTALENPSNDDYYHGPWGLKSSEFDRGYYVCGQTTVNTDLELTTEVDSGSGIRQCTNVYDDVIEWMDALMALSNVSNTTITKVSIGTSSDNKTLYEYIFTPKRYAVTGFPTKQKPIVLIDACIHGFEKNSFFAWYAFLKDMLTRSDSVQLDAVARNVEIHFGPVSNPYGFDNNSYYNANGVNLNRNFDTTDWESITSGTDQSGYADNPQPFDQPESVAISNWISSYPKAMMMFTSHTNGRVTNGYDEMNACMTRFGVAGEYFDRLADVIRRHITEQTLQIPRIYNLNIGSAFCGRWQYAESHGGTEVTWVREAAQIPAMTLETFNGLRVDGSYVIGQFSNNAIKCCAEICGNLLLQVLTEYAE